MPGRARRRRSWTTRRRPGPGTPRATTTGGSTGPNRRRWPWARSRNVPALVVLSRVGVGRAVGVMAAAGLATVGRTPDRYGLSLAVGGAEVTPIELAAAYATLGRGGTARPGDDAVGGRPGRPWAVRAGVPVHVPHGRRAGRPAGAPVVVVFASVAMPGRPRPNPRRVAGRRAARGGVEDGDQQRPPRRLGAPPSPPGGPSSSGSATPTGPGPTPSSARTRRPRSRSASCRPSTPGGPGFAPPPGFLAGATDAVVPPVPPIALVSPADRQVIVPRPVDGGRRPAGAAAGAGRRGRVVVRRRVGRRLVGHRRAGLVATREWRARPPRRRRGGPLGDGRTCRSGDGPARLTGRGGRTRHSSAVSHEGTRTRR